MKVVTREVSTVYPSEPCEPHEVMHLSGADHIVRPRHIPLLLFYKAHEDGHEVMSTKLLKNSLASLLSKYYPVAGRLRRRGDGKLELVCNNAGVEFVEATVDGALDEFDGFMPNRLYTELLDPVPEGLVEAFPEYPIAYIQVTRFTCGGVSLVTTINHACTDGLSVNQFLTSWSEVARGLAITNPPHHNRALLKPHTSPDPNFHPKELRALSSVHLALPTADLGSRPTERMFLFTPNQLNLIKKKATGNGDLGTFSTFEAISAHIWRSITKARALDLDLDLDPNPTKFLTTLDMRKRLKSPNLPEGYFGNAICFVSAEAQPRDIVQNSLSFAVRCIREAIGGFSERYYWDMLAYAERHEQAVVMNVNWGANRGRDVAVASWAGMSFMGLDFGSGPPVFCCPGNNPFDGSVFMLPSSHGDGGVLVFVALRAIHMQRLESDPEFRLHP